MDYKAFHKMSYGLYIVATQYEGRKAGYIANTAFQVTSSPPQIAISCHKNNNTLKYILRSRVLSVSMLKKDVNTSLIGEFGFMSGAEFDKFSKVTTLTKTTGAPVVIDSATAWLDCRVKETLDLGSHVLIICEVVDSGIISDEEPLTYSYYREKYKMLSPRNAPTYIDKEQLGKDVPEVVQYPFKTRDSKSLSSDDEAYICEICGHVYRPEEGDPALDIPPGTSFSDLPEDFRCPVCNAGKDCFKPML